MPKHDNSCDNDYQVGYRKTPKSTRYKPGQCGNLKGRPKLDRRFEALLVKAANRKQWITIDGRRMRMTMKEIMAHQIMIKATKGDLKACALVVQMCGRAEHRKQRVAEKVRPEFSVEELKKLSPQQLTDLALNALNEEARSGIEMG